MVSSPAEVILKLQDALAYLKSKGESISIVNLPDIVCDVLVEISSSHSEATEQFRKGPEQSRMRVESIEMIIGGHAAMTTKAQCALLQSDDPVSVAAFGLVHEDDVSFLVKRNLIADLSAKGCKSPEVFIHSHCEKKSASIPIFTADGKDFIITGKGGPKLSFSSLKREELKRIEEADCLGLVSLRAPLTQEILTALKDGRLHPRGMIFADVTFGTDEATNKQVFESLLVLRSLQASHSLLVSLNEHEVKGFAKFLDKQQERLVSERGPHEAAVSLYDFFKIPLLLHTHDGAMLVGSNTTPFVPSLSIKPKVPFGTGDTLNGAFLLSMLVKERLDRHADAPVRFSHADCVLLGNMTAAFKAHSGDFGSLDNLYNFITRENVCFRVPAALEERIEGNAAALRASLAEGLASARALASAEKDWLLQLLKSEDKRLAKLAAHELDARSNRPHASAERPAREVAWIKNVLDPYFLDFVDRQEGRALDSELVAFIRKSTEHAPALRALLLDGKQGKGIPCGAVVDILGYMADSSSALMLATEFCTNKATVPYSNFNMLYQARIARALVRLGPDGITNGIRGKFEEHSKHRGRFSGVSNRDIGIFHSLVRQLAEFIDSRAARKIQRELHYYSQPFLDEYATKLGKMVYEKAKGFLKELLRSENKLHRVYGAYLLEGCRDADVQKELLSLLKRFSRYGFWPREEAATTLCRNGFDDAEVLLKFAGKIIKRERGTYLPMPYFEELAKINDNHINELLLKLVQENRFSTPPPLVLLAAARTQKDEAIDAIASYLAINGRELKLSALRALSEIGSQRALEAAEPLLTHSDKRIREEATRAFLEFEKRTGMPFLKRLLPPRRTNSQPALQRNGKIPAPRVL